MEFLHEKTSRPVKGYWTVNEILTIFLAVMNTGL